MTSDFNGNILPNFECQVTKEKVRRNLCLFSDHEISVA